jgi:hypothetical protein
MGKPTPKTGNEEHVKGRKAGVSDTYGASRKGVAEKTIPGVGECDGGGKDGLPAAASSIYQKAVKNRGDDQGDKALTER